MSKRATSSHQANSDLTTLLLPIFLRNRC